MSVHDAAQPGQYLTFVLGAQDYAVPVLSIREINQVSEITAVPSTPDFVLGVINLRGKIIPVVDLAQKFAMPKTNMVRQTCIVVIDCDHGQVGVLVDQVNEVADFDRSQIEPAPQLGRDADSAFIIGMGKESGRQPSALEKRCGWRDTSFTSS